MKQGLAEDVVEARRIPTLAPFLGSLHERRFGTGVDSPATLKAYAAEVVDFYEARHSAEPGLGHDGKAARWRSQFAADGDSPPRVK